MINETLTSKKIINILKKNNNILKKYSVIKIGLFGSYVKDENKKSSDIDFLVDFENITFDNFMDLSFKLEDIFHKNIDLITPDSLSPYIKPYIEHKIMWYETK